MQRLSFQNLCFFKIFIYLITKKKKPINALKPKNIQIQFCTFRFD